MLQSHNEIRDTFATLLDEVCHDVEIEPKLQSLEGESFHNKTTTTEDDTRIDIKANRLWGGRFSRTFFDVKIFNPVTFDQNGQNAIYAGFEF